jgi:hypothetical protein
MELADQLGDGVLRADSGLLTQRLERRRQRGRVACDPLEAGAGVGRGQRDEVVQQMQASR